jgi:hypothetical protein
VSPWRKEVTLPAHFPQQQAASLAHLQRILQGMEIQQTRTRTNKALARSLSVRERCRCPDTPPALSRPLLLFPLRVQPGTGIREGARYEALEFCCGVISQSHHSFRIIEIVFASVAFFEPLASTLAGCDAHIWEISLATFGKTLPMPLTSLKWQQSSESLEPYFSYVVKTLWDENKEAHLLRIVSSEDLFARMEGHLPLATHCSLRRTPFWNDAGHWEGWLNWKVQEFSPRDLEQLQI